MYYLRGRRRRKKENDERFSLILERHFAVCWGERWKSHLVYNSSSEMVKRIEQVAMCEWRMSANGFSSFNN